MKTTSATNHRSLISAAKSPSPAERRYRFLLTGALLVFSGGSSAHHMMGGVTPSTASEGFISGLAHPVIGLDHLVFIVALGLLAAWKARPGIGMPIAFVLATVVGCQLHVKLVDIPLVEAGIALSIILGGMALFSRKTLATPWLWAAAAAAGVLHGYAYGESIVGAQTAPTLAYVLGFAIIQASVAVGVMKLARWAMHNNAADTLAVRSRFAGALVGMTGLATAFQVVMA